MATYKQLLLASGGGVISNSQRDDQNDSATIAIGLGGTGVSCLRTLKQQVYSRLKADNPDSPVPSYSHIKFLAIDTDKNSLDTGSSLVTIDPVTEFESISCDNITDLLSKSNLLKDKPELQWLSDKLEIFDASAGAGGVRQIGRLLLIQRSNKIKQTIKYMIEQAKRELPPKAQVTIHIFAGMGGGTGSGTFLDVCYIVKKALQEIGEYGRARVCGYFFLPDVNLSIPAVMASDMISSYIKTNGFAAMKELDHCMNFETNGDCWDQQYDGFRVGPMREAPVDICHLVSSKTTAGTALGNGYDYAMNVVCDFIMQFVVKNDITMETHIANYGSAMSYISKKHGATYRYCLLGAANAVVPLREINTYLASKLFQRFSESRNNAPTDGQIELIAKENGLDFEQLLRSTLEGTSLIMPHPQLDWKMYQNMSEDSDPQSYSIPTEIINIFRNAEQKVWEKAEANISAMTHDWSLNDASVATNSVSKVCKIFESLAAIAGDYNRGPYYAAEVLKGSGRKNLIDLLHGVLEGTIRAKNNADHDRVTYMNSAKAKKHAFMHPGFFDSKPKLFEDFITAVQQDYSNDCRVHVLGKLESAIRKMIEQFDNLYEVFFRPYVIVSNNLVDTFKENYDAINTNTETVEDPFVIPLMRIADMKDSLDNTVEAMSLEAELRDFYVALLRNPDVWVQSDERKICAFVSKYFSDKFSDYTNKTITDYLQIRFNTTDPAQLADCIYNNILTPLSDKATPLFWVSGYDMATNASRLGYCSVPVDASAIAVAAGRLTTAHPELKQIRGTLSDRIFLLRCTVGAPLFAYTGIEEYLSRYQGKYMNGRHLYEKSTGKDWRLLSNLQPYSSINDPDEKLKKDSADYDKAVELGLIHSVGELGVDYCMDIMPDTTAKVDEIKAKFAALAGDAKAKLAAVTAMSAEFDAYVAALTAESTMPVKNDGADGYKEKVRKDHVLNSHELVVALRGELAKKEAIAAMKAEFVAMADKLNAEIQGDKVAAGMRDQYYMALLTGVLEFKLPKVLYTYEDMGIPETIELSNPPMQPYGIKCPLYQAYLTFKSKDEAFRNTINEESNNRYSNFAPEMTAALTALKAQFSNEYMAVLARAVKGTDDEAKIIEFLKGFRRQIEDTCMMFGIA